MAHRITLLLPLLLLGCNRYALFNQAGYEQAAFSNSADILFVIDNSASMPEETAALGANFDSFILQLTSSAGAEPETETLSDAVGNYITYTAERGKFLDYSLAITTTSAGDNGDGVVDPGEGGRFIGAPVVKGDEDLANTFRDQLLCETAYWNPEFIPDGETMETCEEPPKDDNGNPYVTEAYLDCRCGSRQAWLDNLDGAGNEEPFESAFLALCRAAEEPPEACFDPIGVFGQDLPGAIEANEGWLRKGSTVLIVTVSDEGDGSRRLSQTDDEAQVYADAFAEFDNTVKWVSIGPGIDPETGGTICTDGVPTQSVERLQWTAEQTGGFYRDIEVEAEGGLCEVSDFARYLEDIGGLLANLVTAFQLQSVPDVSTIQVWIDGEEVPEAPLTGGSEGQADATYGDGWSYDPAQNAVVFWGSWIPGYNADVEIYYRPLTGNPRELPF